MKRSQNNLSEGGTANIKETLSVILVFLAFAVIEMNVPRIGGRRIAFPLFVFFAAFAALIGTRGVLNKKMIRSSWMSGLPFAVKQSYLVLAGWLLVSASWSIAPAETVMHSMPFFMAFFLAMRFAGTSSEKLAQVFIGIASWIFLLSWLLAAIAPRFAVASHQISWRLQGIMQHEFRLGLLASCVLIIIAIWRRNLSGESRYLPWKYRIIGLVAFVTLVATKTRSLLAYTLLCLVIISVTKASIIKRMIIICFAVTAVFVFEYYGDEIISLFSRGKMDYTLTGRTLIWETTLRVANSAFLAGHGFASFTDPYFDRMWHIFYRPSHSHNGWLQTYFETGIIGVVLMTIFRVIAIALAWRNQKKLLYPSYALFLLLLATMYDMTGLAMGGKISMIYGLVLVFLFQETLTVHMVNNSTNKISQQPK